MDGCQAYTLRKMARTRIWDSYRSQHGGQRYVIGSQSHNRIQKFLLLDLLGNSEIRRQSIGNHGSGKKFK